MKKLTMQMLGVGNGFSGEILNNNALLENGNEKTLIDCGITAWQSLETMDMKIDDVDTIFITHLHFDHSGGLEPAALYTAYMSDKRIKLIVPEPLKEIIWENYLKGSLLNKSEDKTSLEDYFDLVYPKEYQCFKLCGDVNARWIPTKHIKGKFSCGLIIEEKAFYSSDMIYDPYLIEKLNKEDILYYFHDCIFGESKVHGSFNKIRNYPEEVRKRMFLMHHGMAEFEPGMNTYGFRFLEQFVPITLEL